MKLFALRKPGSALFPFLLAMLLNLSLPLANAEDSDSLDSALNSLVGRLEKIETITGSFVQYSIDQKGVRVQESKGDFKAKRPGLFYWYTSSPLEQAIYSNGETVTVYDPDLEQATVQRVNEQIKQTPAILFSGNVDEIGAQFEVDVQQFDGVTTQYVLMPKTEESLFENLRIRFEGQQLVEMRLGDSLGQETTVRFIQTQINGELSAADFEPSFPEGTDVIRDIPVAARPQAQ